VARLTRGRRLGLAPGAGQWHAPGVGCAARRPEQAGPPKLLGTAARDASKQAAFLHCTSRLPPASAPPHLDELQDGRHNGLLVVKAPLLPQRAREERHQRALLARELERQRADRLHNDHLWGERGGGGQRAAGALSGVAAWMLPCGGS
jgi:hypothetical protein